MQETHGNPSSIHGHGRQAGKLLREARQELAQLLETKPQHIFSLLEEQRATILPSLATAFVTKNKENISSQRPSSTMLSLKPLIT